MSAGEDDVRRIELGGGRRRWLLIAAGVLVVWVLAAVLTRSGTDGDDEAAPGDTASAATSTRRPRSTTTSTAIQGAPLLGRETGWHLLVAPGGPGAVVVDLDTGESVPFPHCCIIATRSDGVFTEERGALIWRPFPFDDATAVRLCADCPATAFPVPNSDLAWLVAFDELQAILVRTTDGSVQVRRDLSQVSFVVGTTDDGSLVFVAGGDPFALTADGSVRRVGTGRPIAIVGGHVVLDTCNDELICEAVAVEVRTGATRPAPTLPPQLSAVPRRHPDGRAVAVAPDADGFGAAAFLIGLAGSRRACRGNAKPPIRRLRARSSQRGPLHLAERRPR